MMEGPTTQTPGSDPGKTDRCPSCSALVAADAAWCGQCFAPLQVAPTTRDDLAAKVGIKVTEAPETGTGSGTGGADGAGSGAKVRLTWPCPACENENEIELSYCARCGTSFASLMKADEVPVHIEPREALRLSLVYPGLGHRKAGRGADGGARSALFTISLLFLLMVLFSGTGSMTQTLMVSLYSFVSLAVYAGSAMEAYRIAGGGSPFVTARTLLWITVGVLLISIGLLVLTATTAVRR